MLKENSRFISIVQRISDNFLVLGSFLLAYQARSAALFWNEYFSLKLPIQFGNLAPLKDYLLVYIIALISFNLSLSSLGAYSSMRLRSFAQVFWIGFVCSFITFISLAALLFSLKISVSRSFIGTFCLLVGLFLTLSRFLVLRLLRIVRSKGRNYRNLIICGSGDQAIKLTESIINQPELGIGIRAYASLKPLAIHNEIKFKDIIHGITKDPVVLLNSVNEVEDALKRYAVDEVIFTDVVSVMDEVGELILICSEQGVRTTLAADLFSLGMVKSGISYFGEMPLIHFSTPPGDGWQLYAKRILDILISLLLLILLSPVFFIVAVLIKINTKGPVFFRQKRMGLNGRIFSIYKFRSMKEDAEDQLQNLLKKNEMEGPVFKIKNDPRITEVGKFIRKYSIDELPQLWNVFRGDMSLVGPRPPLPGEVSMYERRDRRRLSMRPGLTCTWQVSGRSQIQDFQAWVKMDLSYIDNWSLGKDFYLLLKTIPVVILGRGAH